jgi:signal transduction histidine kinase
MDRMESPTRRWARSVRAAVNATDGAEAVRGLLEEVVLATGAVAGAILSRSPGSGVVASVRCSPETVSRFLDPDGAVRDALDHAEEWLDEVLTLDAPAPDDSVLLLAPLRVRELCIGALLLRFDTIPPPAPTREAASAFAAVVALLMENARLQEESRTALQSRDHFLMALNHELRTPANALLLNADLLRGGEPGTLPARTEQALHEAETNVRLMIAVLRRVMDLGSLGDQATPPRSEIVNPRELVTDLLRRMEPAAQRKNLALALHVPRSLPALQTDPDRVERILLHLVSNAVKYTATGGVDVRLQRSRRHAGPHRQEPILVIQVTDTGRGIPPEQIERIFEPFTQVDEGARADTGRRGAGLGLPLARQLARSLRGDITLESSPGQGTTASLVLPFHTP